MSNAAGTLDELTGRVAVVTGAAKGIGQAVTDLLLAEGVQVAALDIDTDALARLLETRKHSRLSSFTCDVSDRESVARTIAAVASQLGAPSLLANVAGVLEPACALEVSAEQWAHSFAVNSLGVVHVCQVVVPYMLQNRAGALVTVSSNAASTPRMNFAAYAASKAAASMYTRCLGLELAGHGIRCNVVSPGTTRTDMLRPLFPSVEASEQAVVGDLGQYRCGIPLGRIAEAMDVAQVVVFLLSERARHVTLHDLRVDGGASL